LNNREAARKEPFTEVVSKAKKKITEEFSCSFYFILFLLDLLCFVFSGYFTFLVSSFVS
jgi:hypothetical protein